MKKRNVVFALVVTGLFFMTGCISFYNSVPADSTHVKLEVQVNESYRILGQTEGASDVLVILGFITIGDNGNAVFPTSQIGGSGIGIPLPQGAKGKAECAAAYNALENQPGADRMLDPKWKTEENNYFVFKKVKSTCKGTAIQFIYK